MRLLRERWLSNASGGFVWRAHGEHVLGDGKWRETAELVITPATGLWRGRDAADLRQG
jgi:hypothetical protein